MPVTVYQLEKEAILIASFSGEVNATTLREMYTRSAALLTKTSMLPPIYRITDFRHISSSPEQILKILTEAMQGAAGSTLDPRIKPVLLGDNRWSRLAQGIMEQPQYGNLHLPVFDTMGAALDYARRQLRLRRGVS